MVGRQPGSCQGVANLLGHVPLAVTVVGPVGSAMSASQAIRWYMSRVWFPPRRIVEPDAAFCRTYRVCAVGAALVEKVPWAYAEGELLAPVPPAIRAVVLAGRRSMVDAPVFTPAAAPSTYACVKLAMRTPHVLSDSHRHTRSAAA